MAIRIRRGNQADFDGNKLVAGELGLVLDKGEVYFCYSPGNTKKLMTAEDLQNLLSASPEAYIALQQLIADLTTDPNELANILSNISDLQSGKIDEAEKGVTLATLVDGKVPSEQLPPISSSASDITYDNAESGLNAENGQDAIDEVKAITDDHSSQLAEMVNYIVVNVKKYGAIGDGASHPLSEVFPTLVLAQMKYPRATSLSDEIDWCAIQKAIDSLPSSQWYTSDIPRGGGKVLIPTGRYLCNKTIEVRNAIEISGESKFSTHIWYTDNTVKCITPYYYPEQSYCVGLSINNISLNNGEMGLYLLRVNRSSFENIMLRAQNNFALFNDACVGNEFKNIYVHGCLTDGVYIRGTSAGAYNSTQYFKNLYVAHCGGNGLTLHGSTYGVKGMTFEDVILEYNKGGAYINASSSIATMSSFKNVWLEGNTDYGMQVYSCLDLTLENIKGQNIILVAGANEVSFKDINSDITIQAGAGNRYIQGFVKGSITDAEPSKTKNYNNSVSTGMFKQSGELGLTYVSATEFTRDITIPAGCTMCLLSLKNFSGSVNVAKLVYLITGTTLTIKALGTSFASGNAVTVSYGVM